MQKDLHYSDPESATSTASSGEAVEYAFPVVEEDDKVEKLNPKDKVELPSSKRLAPVMPATGSRLAPAASAMAVSHARSTRHPELR